MTEMNVDVLLCMNECASRMVSMIQGARKSMYYSSFVCQLHVTLPGQPEGTTMFRLLSDASHRGVTIHMFVNPTEQYGNDLSALQSIQGVEVCFVESDGYIPASLQPVFGRTYTNHHQKFLMVDDETLLIGGVGVHPCRAGWMVLNTESPHPYYWHEVGVCLPCSDDMVLWVHERWKGVYTQPPFPLVSGEAEHQFVCAMIQQARACIHMEAQLCISTPTTHNQVLKTVVDRVATAYTTPGDPFCFMMLVNTHQPDEHRVVSFATTATLHWSRRMMMAYATSRGVPESFMRERVFIGTLEHMDGTHIKVHSNIIIADGSIMLRTSSNLTDRSLSTYPCDNELGVVVRGNAVAVAQQKLWSRYFQQEGGTWWPRQAFRCMQDEKGFVCMVKYRKTHNTTFLPTAVIDFFMRHVHKSIDLFGGKRPITWKNRKV